MKKKILCFDIDNVICKTTKSNYDSAIPKKKVIELINKLHDKGYYIKILNGDRVTVEMTTYDLTKGRIILRKKN